MRQAEWSVALLVAVLVVCAHAGILLEKPADPPQEWVAGERTLPTLSVPLVFAVKQRNVDLLQDLLAQVSDPLSPQYGKFLSIDELAALTRQDDSLAIVQEWLASEGVTDTTTTRDGHFIKARMPVDTAERLLDGHYYDFFNQRSAAYVPRMKSYKVPQHIAPHLDFIGYTVEFPNSIPDPDPKNKATGVHAFSKFIMGNDPEITPNFLLEYYNISNPVVTNPGATQSVYENLHQSFSPSDLDTFLNKFNIPEEHVGKVIGPNNPQACVVDPNSCGEANLDVQYMMGVARNASTTYWSIPEEDQAPFLDWIMAVADTPDAPLVHSISYGEVEQAVDPQRIRRFDAEIAKLGLRGLTVFVSSGDDGVSNFPARTDASKCGFFPSFPATSPHVTAVGATQIKTHGEVVCSSDSGADITTGGGFSTVFSTPDFQKDAVQTFLAQSKSEGNLPPIRMFNSKGRGIPDVSVVGHRYSVCIGGEFYMVDGTSASAPVWAAMTTLINSARLNAGKQPVGFLNPLLYRHPEVFNDVRSGHNRCAGRTRRGANCCDHGFYATKGWDPATGLGTPDFEMLLKVAMKY